MNQDEPNRAHGDAAPATAEAAREDILQEWDAERVKCPVSHGVNARGEEEWQVHGHPEAVAILEDHVRFSSRVSPHLSIPSGQDPPEHTKFRAIVDHYFGEQAMSAFEPVCRQVVGELLEQAVAEGGGEAMSQLGEPAAVRLQCAFMGWPPEMRDELTAWQDANERATRSGDRSRTGEVAESFTQKVVALLDERRRLGDEAPDDPTTLLLAEQVDGRPLTDEELVSIIRNWTVGELGSIAASMGIIVETLGRDRELQARLREDRSLLPAAVDEILRVRGPLVANRRVAHSETELGGQRIAAGDRIRVLWPSLNRDERVFEGAAEVDPERDQSDNLLYGTGIHYCPGAPLARLELRVFTEELLDRTLALTLEEGRDPEYAEPPKGGFDRVWYRVESAQTHGQ